MLSTELNTTSAGISQKACRSLHIRCHLDWQQLHQQQYCAC